MVLPVPRSPERKAIRLDRSPSSTKSSAAPPPACPVEVADGLVQERDQPTECIVLLPGELIPRDGAGLGA